MKRSAKATLFLGLAPLLLLFVASGAQSQEARLGSILQKDYDLHPKYSVGDVDFYHMRTVYLEMNDSGRVANTRALDGYFSRQVLRFEDNQRYDHFTWKQVAIGQRKGKGEVTELTVLPYSQNFQYDFSEKEMTPAHFPVDLASVPKTMEGYHFFVNLIDAHTFDVLRNFEAYDHDLSRIGQTTRLPGQDLEGLIDFPPLFTNTRFAQGPVFTTFQGITLYQNQPSAILSFRADDSQIHMVANMMGMKLPSDGTSYYWGDIVLSLQSGRILRGRLFEHVVSATSLGANAQTARSIVRREIGLEKISREEFEAGGPKSTLDGGK